MGLYAERRADPAPSLRGLVGEYAGLRKGQRMSVKTSTTGRERGRAYLVGEY